MITLKYSFSYIFNGAYKKYLYLIFEYLAYYTFLKKNNLKNVNN